MGSWGACQGFSPCPPPPDLADVFPPPFLTWLMCQALLQSLRTQEPTVLPEWPLWQGRTPVFCLWPWMPSLGFLVTSSHGAWDIRGLLPTAECWWHPACFLARGHTGGHLACGSCWTCMPHCPAMPSIFLPTDCDDRTPPVVASNAQVSLPSPPRLRCPTPTLPMTTFWQVCLLHEDYSRPPLLLTSPGSPPVPLPAPCPSHAAWSSSDPSSTSNHT